MKITPITAGVGVIVETTPAEAADPANAPALLEAMNKYGVVVLPRIGMSDAQFVQMTENLGERHSLGYTADDSTASNQGIYRIALDKDDQTQLDFIKGNDFWHMDGTSYDVPGKATLLKCENPPSEGGDTGFANLHAAYEALPEEKKQKLKSLEVEHCMAAVGRRMYEHPTEDDFARWNAVVPPRRHPLVWQQNDGRCSLLIGSTANCIVGMDEEEGAALLDQLMEWATQPQFTYRHHWQKGDVVMFNNPALLHRSYPYEERAGRVMHRTTLLGTEPIRAAA